MNPTRLMVGVLTGAVFAATAQAGQFKIHTHTFTLPDGFEIELAAGPPLVDRPIACDFDEQGRLYVADSAGVSHNVKQQLEEKPHRIVRLTDTDGDGVFDHSVVFADRMMFPEGVLWFNGAVYSGAPPSIWKLEDTNGDGMADRRSEWFEGKTLTGCANDLHGPYLGPDGWIYWCKGAFARQTHDRPGRSTIADSAAHIFRSRPDGSEFDSVMSGGMDNPVEIAFTSTGEPIFTTTFYSHPEAGKRDALVHAIYGGVYPKVHGVLDGLKRTGDLMPPITHLGPAVPSGLVSYTSEVFGRDFQGNLFSTLFNLHKVQRHILEQNGGTFRTRDLDFLVSDNPDFHPTDVLEDADGSLLVIDTGGWYKICCPTSQLAKPDVLGGIYRIRRTHAPKVDDPRGLKLDWANLRPSRLVRLLGDRRPAVQKRAITQLGQGGESAIPSLARAVTRNQSAEVRRNAVWALTWQKSEKARAAVRPALADSDLSVREAAVHSAGIWRDGEAIPRLIECLDSTHLHLQRKAATALGQIGAKQAVPHLLKLASHPLERVMEHAMIYALIEIGDRESTRAGLQASSSHTRRAALIALDQMDGGGLVPGDVAPLLASPDKTLKETAVWISGHHPEWGGALAGFFKQRLAQLNDRSPDRDELEQQLAQFAQNSAIQELIAATLLDNHFSGAARQTILRSVARARLKEAPKILENPLRQILQTPDEPLVRAALAAIRALPVSKTNALDFSDRLLAVGKDSAFPSDLKVEALAAILSGLSEVSNELFEFLVNSVRSGQSPAERSGAAAVLGKAKLTDEQLSKLADAVKEAGPLELPKLLTAFDRGGDDPTGFKLIASLRASKILRGLRPDMIKPRLAKFSASVQGEGERLLQELNIGAVEQKARLESLIQALKYGDIRRGQAIFNGQRAACATCHQVGYLGGRVGPDLTRIGAVRTDHDLLESILFPSVTFVRSYEPMIVQAKDGEEYSGVLRQETSDSIVLVSGTGLEQRISLANVAEMRPGTVSVMPEGLDQQLSHQEIADLVAFLKSLK